MSHEIKRTYRYRLCPNKAQKAELARTFGCSRWVYNWALETKTKAYYQDDESLSFTDLSSRLTSKKKEEGTEWLSEVSAVTLQQSLRNLNQAFTNFFEGRAEYPSFKSKKGDYTARYVGTAFDIREENGKRKLRLSKTPGLINIRWSRELPSEPSGCTVTKNAAGQYHVCFVCTEDVETLPRINGEDGDLAFVGVDVGIESLVALSTGEKVGTPPAGSRTSTSAFVASSRNFLAKRRTDQMVRATTGSGNENVWRRSTGAFRTGARTSSRS